MSILSQSIIDSRDPLPRVVPLNLGFFKPSGEAATLIAGDRSQYLRFIAISEELNDEGLKEHPLARLGLYVCGLYEVFNSRWTLDRDHQARQSTLKMERGFS